MSAPTYGGTGHSLEELEHMPYVQGDAVLARTIADLEARMATVQQQLDECRSLLRERLMARGATEADCGEFEAKLQVVRSYEYDFEGLTRLGAYIDADDFERAVRWVTPEPQLRIDKRELNKLAKRGGAVAEIIAAATREVSGPGRLLVTMRRVQR